MNRLLLIGLMLLCIQPLFGQDWKGRENWPDDFPRPPKTKERLFFLQRNLNRNTIAYDLNLKSDGQIDANAPLEVYWMRYTGGRNGVIEETTWFQRQFAFGYSSTKKGNNEFLIKLVAYKERRIQLKQLNGTWVAIMKINGSDCRLTNVYVYADESGLMPDVKHVDLYGISLETGKAVKERFYNN